MATLTNTGLESHPVGTSNPNGIINGNWLILEALAAANGLHRPAFAALTYGASVNLSFWGAKTRRVVLSGDITVAFTDLAAGRDVTLYIKGDGSSRTLTWPASVSWLGATAPGTLAAGKTLRVHFFSVATTAADVIADWSVEP